MSEQFDVRDNHRFSQVIGQYADLEKVASGFRFLEGPIWHPYQKSLTFSDILGNGIYRWSEHVNHGSDIYT